MRRRNFIKLTSLGIAALALPAFGAYSTSTQEALTGIIFNEFHFLKIDPKGVEQFVKDYYTLMGTKQRFYISLKTKAYYLFKVDSDKSQLIRTLTTLYLLSTDFFLNRMDESKEVKYLGWYNPHKTPCANPFSSIYYPTAVS